MATQSQSIAPLFVINKDRIDWKIEVCVCRKWRIPSSGRIPETLEFLLVDVQGSRIQASVKKFHISKFEDKLREGDCYTVAQFSVLDRPKTYAVAEFPYRIVFHASTSIRPLVNHTFPRSVFQFKKFLDIIDGSQKEDGPLFDVIGTVIDINDSRMNLESTIKGSKSIQIYIEDIDTIGLKCVLWEPYCFEVQNFFESIKHIKEPQVIVIQLCRAKAFRGEVGIQNTIHATKLIFDQNLEEIRDFKNRLPRTTVSNSFDGSRISSNTFVAVMDELQSLNTVFFTIRDIQTADVPVKVWVVVSIAEILYDRGWSYISCLKCKKKVKETDARFFCGYCKTFIVGEERFKIHLNVVDGTANAIFLLWNDIAHHMIGKTAEEVCDQMLRDSDDTEDLDVILREAVKHDLPQPIDALIGKEYLFKISIEHKHIEGKDRVYVVEKYSEDQKIISKYKKSNHDTYGTDSASCKDVMDETNIVEEESSNSPSTSNFKTPEPMKTGKRTTNELIRDGEGYSSSKLHKSD